MKKIASLLVLAVAALGLTSCFEYKGTITVSKDGTATLEETALMSAQFKAMMAGAAGGSGGGGASIKGMSMDRAKAEERAKKLGEGVTVKSFEEVTTPDGRSGAKVVYAVANINKFKFAPEGNKNATKEVTFALSGNTLTINNPDEKKEEKPAAPDMPREAKIAQLGMIKPMLAGMRVSIEVKAAGGIASTDADHVAGDTITLGELDIDKLGKNEGNLVDVLTSMEQKMTSAEAAAKFKGIDGVKMEGKQVVKVTLK